MKVVSPGSLLIRLVWILFFIMWLVAVPLMNRYRGGDIEGASACILTSSKTIGAADSVLIFGSSRTITFFDHFYINEILQNEVGMGGKSVERLALKRRDSILAYFLLENRLRYGTPPELVVLELMVDAGTVRLADANRTLRQTAMLDFGQLTRRKIDFGGGSTRLGVADYVSIYIDRTTALIYGFIEKPLSRDWDSLRCKLYDDFGLSVLAYEPRETTGGVEAEVVAARRLLQEDYDGSIGQLRAPGSKWDMEQQFVAMVSKGNLKTPKDEYIYTWENELARKDVNDLKMFIALAETNGVKVLLVPIIGYGLELSGKEMEKIKATFPGVSLFSPTAQAGPVLDAYWFDSHHLSRKGSVLTSALLAQEIVEELSSD
jgi:hypothetical protein